MIKGIYTFENMDKILLSSKWGKQSKLLCIDLLDCKH